MQPKYWLSADAVITMRSVFSCSRNTMQWLLPSGMCMSTKLLTAACVGEITVPDCSGDIAGSLLSRLSSIAFSDDLDGPVTQRRQAATLLVARAASLQG